MKHRHAVLAAMLVLATALAGCSDHKKDDHPAPQPSVSSSADPALSEVPKPAEPTAPVTDGSAPDDVRSLLPSE
jgi:hypothetical protein